MARRKRFTQEDLDAAYAAGFAAQRDAEAVLVLDRVLEYVRLDLSVYLRSSWPTRLYLSQDLIPWLRRLREEASS